MSPTVFWPVPNVDSGLVALVRRDPPPTTATREQVFAVVDAAFGQRRKMLRSALAGLAGSSAAAVEALEAAGVDPQARGEVLDVTAFARIAERLGGGASVPGMASPLPPSPVGVHVRAPAKINLALKVGRPRPDGYHPLATVYHAVSLYDDVHAEWAEPDEFELEVSGEGVEDVPLDDNNLALRAARLLARVHGGQDRLGVRLTIRKSIPVAAGLAGGSADGAAALLACATLWDIDLAPEVLRHLGAELGSDVPFSLLGGTAVGGGRGEDVAPALARGSYHWVLAFGHQGLSTPAVYRRFDELNPDPVTAGGPAGPDERAARGRPVRAGCGADQRPAARRAEPAPAAAPRPRHRPRAGRGRRGRLRAPGRPARSSSRTRRTRST